MESAAWCAGIPDKDEAKVAAAIKAGTRKVCVCVFLSLCGFVFAERQREGEGGREFVWKRGCRCVCVG